MVVPVTVILSYPRPIRVASYKRLMQKRLYETHGTLIPINRLRVVKEAA